MSANAAALPDDAAPELEQRKSRLRMKPGQRREQILQTLAGMLEQPGTERSTTALLTLALRQVLRVAADANKSSTPTADAHVRATVLVAFTLGQLQRFTRSGFKRSPLDHLDASLALMCR
ncbi:hypothetical protein [Limnohabitans sp.]|uniref:hypothetical protein n=1 Tax=Limnohabitans sp. TaxID=1907725 RepID=UPI00286F38B2|nr:hypothetical protein [Limnohabitans sp.]